MKVFLVDDEHFIIEMLKRIINWESMGMEIVGHANNGQSAIEGILERRPDIIITDIRMPVIDGLELIRKVVGKGIKTHFIVISGYKNFEYAQTAMKYGVKEYILKPINGKELKESLLRITGDMKKDDSETAEITHVASIFKQKMRQLLISSIIKSYYVPGNDLMAVNKEYCTNFQNGHFKFITLRIDNAQKSCENIFDQYNGIGVNTLEDLCFDIISYCDGGNQWLLTNYDRSNEEKINKAVGNSLKQVEQKLGNYLELRICGAMGSSVEHLAEITKSLNTCREALKNRILNQSNALLYYPAANRYDHIMEEVYPDPEQKAFIRNVTSASFENAKMQISKVFLNLKSRNLKSANPYWRLSIMFFESFWAEMDNVFHEEAKPSADEFKQQLSECSSVDDIQRVCIDSTITHCIKMFDKDECSGNAVIAITKRYIHEHYQKKITLEDISNIVYLNPFYLSARFKRETGITFSTYLNDYRIGKAKQLLQQLDMPISEVAIHIGIPDSRYFARAFKKSVGLSPKDYRKKFAFVEGMFEEGGE